MTIITRVGITHDALQDILPAETNIDREENLGALADRMDDLPLGRGIGRQGYRERRGTTFEATFLATEDRPRLYDNEEKATPFYVDLLRFGEKDPAIKPTLKTSALGEGNVQLPTVTATIPSRIRVSDIDRELKVGKKNVVEIFERVAATQPESGDGEVDIATYSALHQHRLMHTSAETQTIDGLRDEFFPIEAKLSLEKEDFLIDGPSNERVSIKLRRCAWFSASDTHHVTAGVQNGDPIEPKVSVRYDVEVRNQTLDLEVPAGARIVVSQGSNGRLSDFKTRQIFDVGEDGKVQIPLKGFSSNPRNPIGIVITYDKDGTGEQYDPEVIGWFALELPSEVNRYESVRVTPEYRS